MSLCLHYLLAVISIFVYDLRGALRPAIFCLSVSPLAPQPAIFCLSVSPLATRPAILCLSVSPLSWQLSAYLYYVYPLRGFVKFSALCQEQGDLCLCRSFPLSFHL